MRFRRGIRAGVVGAVVIGASLVIGRSITTRSGSIDTVAVAAGSSAAASTAPTLPPPATQHGPSTTGSSFLYGAVTVGISRDGCNATWPYQFKMRVVHSWGAALVSDATSQCQDIDCGVVEGLFFCGGTTMYQLPLTVSPPSALSLVALSGSSMYFGQATDDGLLLTSDSSGNFVDFSGRNDDWVCFVNGASIRCKLRLTNFPVDPYQPLPTSLDELVNITESRVFAFGRLA